MIRIDMNDVKRKMQRCRNAGSVFFYDGKRVGVYGDTLSILQRARIEAQEVLRQAGAGALFNIYEQLVERWGNLIILLPVARAVDTVISQYIEHLETLKVIATDNTKSKIYCLPHYLGINSSQALDTLRRNFDTNPEQTMSDIREMLTHAVHLTQEAQKLMQKEHAEIEKDWEPLKRTLDDSEMVNAKIEAIKRTVSHGGADAIFVDEERVYNYIASAFGKSERLARSTKHWRQELLNERR